MFASEIRRKLLVEGVCTRHTLPSESAIVKMLRRKLGMTRKKISSRPKEEIENIWKVDEYLQRTWDLTGTTLHFFDESSVVKTTSNRAYGSSYKGANAIEIQRYASNATYTVNLLHSVFGVDYFNIIPGASNGNELVAFFNYALTCVRRDGLPVFVEGDTVIMDNCGFHHGRATERTLRLMLGMHGITLLFQPLYSPHLNTCEYCFHQMKQALKHNENYSQEYTEMAIIDALNDITATQSLNYFQHCGYII
jgi:transposase